MTWTALFMAWGEGQNLGIRWEQACQLAGSLHPHWTLGQSYSGFVAALVRSSKTVVTALKRRFQRLMQEQAGKHWTVRGWQVFAVDGTRIEAPHTAQNETGLGCAGKVKSAPQVFLTSLWHVGLGLPWDFCAGPGTTSERTHAHQLADALPARSLLVADAGFASYAFCRQLLRCKQNFLLRVGGNIMLLTELGYGYEKRNGIVYLWPKNHRGSQPLLMPIKRYF